MTNKQAIENLKVIKKKYAWSTGADEALDMGADAIDALMKIRMRLNRIINEPSREHMGEDWRFGLSVALDVIDKYTKDADEEKIKVGDEVCLDEQKFIVTSVGKTKVYGFAPVGVVIGQNKRAVKKTGRHFDEIENILRTME